MNYIQKTCLMLAALMLCVYGSAAFAQTSPSENAIVEQFYPQQWLAEDGSMGLYDYADADFDGTGTANYIVVAYTNGVAGAVRVLEKQGVSAVVVAAPSFPLMGGANTRVRLIDVDGDGIPEVDVSFASVNGRNQSDWILKWTGSTLKSIGPVSTDYRGDISTELCWAVFMDLTGTGKLDIISAPEQIGNNEYANGGIDTVYSLVNGQYKQSGTLNEIYYYRKSKGAPVATVKQFTVLNPSGPYVMTIINGLGKDKLVSGAAVVLNGVSVASVKHSTGTIKVPVTLQTSNTLSVTLHGAPGSVLTIGIGTTTSP